MRRDEIQQETKVTASNNGGESGITNVRDMLERYVESFDEWSKMQDEELENEEKELEDEVEE